MIIKVPQQPVQYVPDKHPFGSVTDGDWVCGRCREAITGCALCAGEVVHVVRVKGHE